MPLVSDRDSGNSAHAVKPGPRIKMKNISSNSNAQKSNINGVNNNVNAEASEMYGANSSTAEVAKKQNTYKTQPVYQVLNKARKIFANQMVKNEEVKSQSIERALEQSKLYTDRLGFYTDFKKERDRMVDSKRFCKECAEMERDPETVADHATFLGKATVADIIANGPIAVLGEKIRLYQKPLMRDEYGLFRSNQSSEEVAND